MFTYLLLFFNLLSSVATGYMRVCVCVLSNTHTALVYNTAAGSSV